MVLFTLYSIEQIKHFLLCFFMSAILFTNCVLGEGNNWTRRADCPENLRNFNWIKTDLKKSFVWTLREGSFFFGGGDLTICIDNGGFMFDVGHHSLSIPSHQTQYQNGIVRSPTNNNHTDTHTHTTLRIDTKQLFHFLILTKFIKNPEWWIFFVCLFVYQYHQKESRKAINTPK